MTASSPAARRKRAIESFKTAADCLGPIYRGMDGIFAITRGQWSMIDAILHCLDQINAPCRLSLWTWTIADYEIQCLQRLMQDARLANATLVIDHGARNKNQRLLDQWMGTFGAQSIRLVLNHGKIATIEGNDIRLLLRGSMNLNFNPRFEQFDLTEGGQDFELVRQIESELEILPPDAPGREPYRVSKVSQAFDTQTIDMFRGLKPWTK